MVKDFTGHISDVVNKNKLFLMSYGIFSATRELKQNIFCVCYQDICQVQDNIVTSVGASHYKLADIVTLSGDIL